MIARRLALALSAAVLTGFLAQAGQAGPLRVGVSISTTGPAASLGIAQRNTFAMLPKTLGGHDVEYFVLDDGADSTKAVANARKLIDEDHVDVLIGSSTTPASLAMEGVAAEKQIPMISLAASVLLIAPMDASRRWVFKTPQNDSLMADAIATHMQQAGIKTVAFIGFNDAYGDGWFTEFSRAAAAHGITITDSERFARPDSSVTGQTLKMMATKPQAVLVAGAGTPAALPQKTLRERGFQGMIYQTHGVANNDFLRVGGKDVEGTILPAGPVLVAAQLPDGNPLKAQGLAYTAAYEAAYGAGSMSTFGAHAYDATLLIADALPAAMAQGEPGTQAFRAGLRDGIEGLHDAVLTQGIASLSPTEHNGFDERARVMVTIKGGAWLLIK